MPQKVELPPTRNNELPTHEFASDIHYMWSDWVTPILRQADYFYARYRPGVTHFSFTEPEHPNATEDQDFWEDYRLRFANLPRHSWEELDEVEKSPSRMYSRYILEPHILDLTEDEKELGAAHIHAVTIEMRDHMSRNFGPDLVRRWRRLTMQQFESLNNDMQQKDYLQAKRLLAAIGRTN